MGQSMSGCWQGQPDFDFGFASRRRLDQSTKHLGTLVAHKQWKIWMSKNIQSTPLVGFAGFLPSLLLVAAPVLLRPDHSRPLLAPVADIHQRPRTSTHPRHDPRPRARHDFRDRPQATFSLALQGLPRALFSRALD